MMEYYDYKGNRIDYDKIRLKAKQEVFDDIEKFDSRFGHDIDSCVCFWCKEYNKVKKKHLKPLKK